MSLTSATANLFADLPREMVDTIFHFLPQYSLLGKHSVSTVSKQWNNVFTHSSLMHEKATSEQLVDSIQTEEEALLVFDNDKIYHEMNYTQLLRLAFKISDVRKLIYSRLTKSQIYDLCAYDINNARFFLALNIPHITYIERLVITSQNALLCDDFLKDTKKLSAKDAIIISEKISFVARKILNTPRLSKYYTNRQRFSIMANHTPLVEENLEFCASMLDKDLAKGDERAFERFLNRHRQSRVVADFLLTRFEPIFTARSYFLANLASCHLHIARRMFEQDAVIKKLDYHLLLEIIDAHYEMAEKLIANPDLVIKEYYADTVFRIIMKHFPRSKCFLEKEYHLGADFHIAYGPLLALPRIQQMLASGSPSAYDFKVAFAHSLFENPEIMLQPKKLLMRYLADVIDDLRSFDFEAMKPAIIKLLNNLKQRNDLFYILALQLFGKMPFLFDEQQINGDYFNKVFVVFNFLELPIVYKNYRDAYLTRYPVMARKIMDTPDLVSSLPSHIRESSKISLQTREVIQLIVEHVKCESALKKPDSSFKP